MISDRTAHVRLGMLVNRLYDDEFTLYPGQMRLHGLGFNPVEILWSTASGQSLPSGMIVEDVNDGTRVVALPGTRTNAQWWENLEFGKQDCPFFAGTEERVHGGFADIYSTLRTLYGPATESIPAGAIWVGHSLGAALATLGAAECGASLLLTFGSPRVGNKAFCRTASGRIKEIVRYAIEEDPVRRVPFDVFNFDHLGQATWLHRGEDTKDSPYCSHCLDTYLHLLDPREPLAKQCVEEPRHE